MIAWLTVPGADKVTWKEVKKICPEECAALLEKVVAAGGKTLEDACGIFLAVAPCLKLDTTGRPLMGEWTNAWKYHAAFCKVAEVYEDKTAKPLFVNMPLIGIKPVAPR